MSGDAKSTVADRFMAYVEDHTPFEVTVVPSDYLRPGKCVPPSIRGGTWVVAREDYNEIVKRLGENR